MMPLGSMEHSQLRAPMLRFRTAPGGGRRGSRARSKRVGASTLVGRGASVCGAAACGGLGCCDRVFGGEGALSGAVDASFVALGFVRGWVILTEVEGRGAAAGIGMRVTDA